MLVAAAVPTLVLAASDRRRRDCLLSSFERRDNVLLGARQPARLYEILCLENFLPKVEHLGLLPKELPWVKDDRRSLALGRPGRLRRRRAWSSKVDGPGATNAIGLAGVGCGRLPLLFLDVGSRCPENLADTVLSHGLNAPPARLGLHRLLIAVEPTDVKR